MKGGYVELEYRRKEDGIPVTLLAPLPTVRSIAVGGAPEELRLPGASPDAVFGRIEPHDGQSRLMPAVTAAPSSPTASGSATSLGVSVNPGAPTAPGPSTAPAVPTMRLNNRPVHGSGVILEPHDVVRIEHCQLTFHEGEPPGETPLIATHLRWSLPQTLLEDANVSFDEGSRAHIDEFELSIRPYMQAERYGHVQHMAEKEIQRVVRSAEMDSLDGYMQYLWWTRIRMAREADDERAGDIAREAYDLFPESRLLMVTCGLTFMTESKWDTASEAFERALRPGGRTMLVSVHDARVGKRLVAHWSTLADDEKAKQPFPAELLDTKDWDVPEIELDAPGDDVLMCRMAWHGRLFGPCDALRFVYYGKDEERGSEQTDYYRWEIHDTSRGLVWRRIVKIPALPWPDPSLCLEVEVIRQGVMQHQAFSRLFVDRSGAVRSPGMPVLFDDSALAAIPKKIGKNVITCARLSRQTDRIWLVLLRRPEQGDVVYRQGDICVAVSEEMARTCREWVLTHERKSGFSLHAGQGSTISVRYKGVSWQHRRVSPGWTAIIASSILAGAVAIRLLYWAFAGGY